MKHIKLGFIFYAMFFCFPLLTEAQTVTENETDSINTSKDQLVQVAFRKVAQSNILGGVSIINMEEVTKKNYNIYSLDNLQGYIGGWNGSSIWGMSDFLVLVDGVPRDVDNVVPSEIEQITFLKGANAVALYGSYAAKGVIYITTKRGVQGPLKVSVRANNGYHVAKAYPKYLGSAEYMTLYNEARVNDGKSPLYSDETIYNTASGTNPYRYPDVDFYSSDYIKKTFNRWDVATEISGGNERAQFYTNIGYLRQGDFLKFGEAKNNNIDRLNIRGNVDIAINDWVKAFVNANATFYNSQNANGGSYWTAASTMRPNRVAPLIPLSYIEENDLASLDLANNSRNIIDGKYFLAGSQTDMTNIFADYYAAGYSKWTSRQFQFDTGLDFDLANVLKGLSFHTKFAVDYSTSYTTSYNNTYATLGYSLGLPSWSTYNGKDVVTLNQFYGKDEKSGIQNIAGSSNRQIIALSSYLAYEASINNVHNFSAMLIATGFQYTQTSVYHKPSSANLGLQLGYNFKGKYFAEFNGAALQSSKFAEGHRVGISPSLTLGWYLSKEGFLANSSFVDDLVLSASASNIKTDMDIADNYMYKGNYAQGDGAWWGWYDGASERSTNSRRSDNYDLTFIQRKELAANIRGSLWKRLITFDATYFMNTMEGLVIKPSTVYPNYFSTGYPESSFSPYVNFNSDKRTGFDFSVYLNKRLGSIDYTLGVSGLYYTTEASKREHFGDYRDRQGYAIDGIWGLQNAGFFSSTDDIATSPQQKFQGELKPGDIKYVDQNNDNIIDEKDQVYLARGGWYGAPFTMGVNLTLKWKNLTFFALGTGYFGLYSIKSSSYYWVYGEGKYSEVVRDRWTEQTQATATYPRLTTTDGSNNFRASDFWLVKTDRFNLSKVQITYDLPKNMLTNFFLHEISAYISGSNLLTLSKERELLERNAGSSPQTRFYTIGVKASF
jgi:TonB-linked SusC/RagA family outer membrane protein